MIAGIAFAVLFAAALLMVPTLPGIDKPGYDVVSHVNEHSGTMRMQALLVTFGSLALVVVLGYARDRLTGPPAYVFTIGSAVVLVEVFIAMWFTAGLALHPDQLGSATVRTITDIAVMWGPILTVAEIMVAVPILLAANDDRVETLDDGDVERVKCLRHHRNTSLLMSGVIAAFAGPVTDAAATPIALSGEPVDASESRNVDRCLRRGDRHGGSHCTANGQIRLQYWNLIADEGQWDRPERAPRPSAARRGKQSAVREVPAVAPLAQRQVRRSRPWRCRQ